jgi:oxygen-dependent protoporphyrinogen oxidase
VSGLTAAFSVLADAHRPTSVTVLESAARTGGLIRTSPFAGLPGVDEGADAFLTRVPWATQLAADLGLGAALTSPTGAGACVWHDRLHEIPGDILMGVPARMRAFATSRLFSTRGKMRAALEPLVPRIPHDDSIGRLVRRRFGREVHERLVDPLVGSIYAADTDSFSLEAVPQINALTSRRSLLLAAAEARKVPAQAGPVFAVPMKGMGSLVDALAASPPAAGSSARAPPSPRSRAPTTGTWLPPRTRRTPATRSSSPPPRGTVRGSCAASVQMRRTLSPGGTTRRS